MPGYVGVAPGTTTIFIPSQQNTLGWACGADSPWAYITPPGYTPPYPSTSSVPACPSIYPPPYALPALTLTPQELSPQTVPVIPTALTPQSLPPQTIPATLYPQRLSSQTIPVAPPIPFYPSPVPAQIATYSPSSVSTRADAASQGYSLPRTNILTPTTTLPYSAPRTVLAPAQSPTDQLRAAQECQNRRYLNPYATESLLRDAAIQGTFNGFGSGFSTTLGVIAGLVTSGAILTYLLSRKI